MNFGGSFFSLFFSWLFFILYFLFLFRFFFLEPGSEEPAFSVVAAADFEGITAGSLIGASSSG